MNPAQRFFGMYVDGGYRPAQSGNEIGRAHV